MSTKKGRKFEDKAYKILKKHNVGKGVHKRVKVMGNLSKTLREIDLKIDCDKDGYIAFECKDKNRPVDSPVVEGFKSKLDNLGAQKGAIISNSGFTRGATNLAKVWDIDLLSIVDTEDESIRAQLLLPSKLCVIRPVDFSLRIRVDGGVTVTKDFEDPSNVTFSNGVNISSQELFRRLWNSGAMARGAGTWEYHFPENLPAYIAKTKSGEIPARNVSFIYTVEEECFFGEIGVEKTEGVYDLRKKSYSSTELVTENLDIDQAIKDWSKNEPKDFIPIITNVVSVEI